MTGDRLRQNVIIRQLDPEELAEYRRPFVDPARRGPTLTGPRELPIDLNLLTW
jgi:haloalkane dehalogenase